MRLHPDTRQVQLVTFARERTDHLVLDPDIEDDMVAIRIGLAGQAHERRRRIDADDVVTTSFQIPRNTTFPASDLDRAPAGLRHQSKNGGPESRQ